MAVFPREAPAGARMSNTVASHALEVQSVSKKAVLSNYGVVFAVKNIKMTFEVVFVG